MEQRIRQSMACYDAHLTALDACLGQVLAAVEDLGLAADTLVVFMADHGSMHWSHGKIRKQYPWEESIRVPMSMRAPGKLPVGRSSEVLTGIVDVAPTLLDLLGQPVPLGMDGASVVPWVRGEVPPPRSMLIGVPVPADGMTEEGVDRGWRGVRTQQHTYARWEDGEHWILYDNQADPYQQRNLALDPTAAEVRDRLEHDLEEHLEAVDDLFLPCGVICANSGWFINGMLVTTAVGWYLLNESGTSA